MRRSWSSDHRCNTRPHCLLCTWKAESADLLGYIAMSTGEELQHSKEAVASIFKACAVKDNAGNNILHNVGNYLPIDVASYPPPPKKRTSSSTPLWEPPISKTLCFFSGGEYYDLFYALFKRNRPPLWSSGQSFWLQIQRSRFRFPALPDFLSSSGSGTGSTQPREVNWGATWIKSSGSGLENRD